MHMAKCMHLKRPCSERGIQHNCSAPTGVRVIALVHPHSHASDTLSLPCVTCCATFISTRVYCDKTAECDLRVFIPMTARLQFPACPCDVPIQQAFKTFHHVHYRGDTCTSEMPMWLPWPLPWAAASLLSGEISEHSSAGAPVTESVPRQPCT